MPDTDDLRRRLREARAECGELRALVKDRCRLICDMQRALGIGCADGYDADPVAICKHMAAELRRLRAAARRKGEPHA